MRSRPCSISSRSSSALAQEKQRRLGKLQARAAALRAQLAALIASLTGEDADAAAADAAEHARREAEEDRFSPGAADELVTGKASGESEEDAATESTEPNAREASDSDDDAARNAAKNRRSAHKQLYLQLIKRWHPDLATNEDDRARRTEITARITAWWRDGDFESLQRLWDEGVLPEAETSDTQQWTVEQLEHAIEALREELLRTRTEIAALLSSDLERLHQDVLGARLEGRDFLDDLARTLDEEISELGRAIAELAEAHT